MKLHVGMPLATKNGHRYSNAVVYKIAHGKDRDIITVLTDYGNLRHLPSVEDLFEEYEISKVFTSTVDIMNELGLGQEWAEGQFNIRDRLQQQIDLLKSALEGLE